MATITSSEKKFLLEKGYSRSDVQEIVMGAKKTIYRIVSQKEPEDITEEEAIERLGREEWLRGIARSTFYNTTTRYGLNGEQIQMKTVVYAN